MKNLITIISLFFFLLIQSCGYAPIYGKSQKVNFYIKEINFNNSDNGDKELNFFIRSNLNKYLINNGGDAYKIETSIKYEKISLSKDSSGTTEEYQLSSEVIFKITANKTEILKIKEIFKMNNLEDEFKEREYEKTIKQNMARTIVSKLIIQLSKFNDS